MMDIDLPADMVGVCTKNTCTFTGPPTTPNFDWCATKGTDGSPEYPAGDAVMIER